MNIFNRADIKAARWLDKQNHFRILVDFARNDRFLLIAAAHGAHNGVAALAAPNVILLNQLTAFFIKLVAL